MPNIDASAKRIDDTRVRGHVDCFCCDDRRGLKRAPEVGPPEFCSSLDVVRLRRTVEALNADDRVAGNRRCGNRPYRLRLPDHVAAGYAESVQVPVLPSEEDRSTGCRR